MADSCHQCHAHGWAYRSGCDGEPLGRVCHGLGRYERGEPDRCPNCASYRLMIDRDHRRKGYGRAAMREVIARLRATPDCPDVLIGYEPDNAVAARLYRELGFEEIGPAPWGETLACLKLGVVG
ncbi:MAG TPA: GNAT family N-acetyltransferase [Thermomicrobiales bacterium]|nr:GNAT family N-acetyltransferase [Thermomicrobiales bacterium]